MTEEVLSEEANKGCAEGQQDYPAYSQCLYECSCGLDLNETELVLYCDTLFPTYPAGEVECLCRGSRCMNHCVATVGCSMSDGYEGTCLQLAAALGCDLGCAQDAAEMIALVSELPTCIEDIPDTAPSEPLPVKGGSISGAIVTALVLGSAALLMIAIGGYTYYRTRQKPRQGGGISPRAAVIPPSAATARASNTGGPDPRFCQPSGETSRGPQTDDDLPVEALELLSVFGLKSYMAKRSIPCTGCIEKRDLIERICEYSVGQAQYPSTA